MISKTIFNPKYKSMIKTLIEIRKQQGINQRQLATKLKKAHSYVGRFETNQLRIDVIEFINICRALNLSDKEIMKLFGKLL